MLDGPIAEPTENTASPNLIIRGPDEDLTITSLDRDCQMLGRHPGCPVRLTHAKVSARHAIAVPLGQGVFLLDLGSRTGIRTRQGGVRSAWISSKSPAAIGPFHIATDALPTGGTQPPDDPMQGFIGDREAIPEVQLQFIGGSLQGTKYRLKRAITLIGRGPRCKIRLRDSDAISSVHACLVLDERGLMLIDTLSRSGVCVDGELVAHTSLCEGQRFQIGSHLVEVVRCRLPADRNSGTLHSQSVSARPNSAAMQLASFLKKLGDVAEAERGDALGEWVGSERMTSWQALKARRKNPSRLILDDRFLLMEPVGRGGMGTVYRAIDLETDETVAVKMPKSRADDPVRQSARVRREILISSGLDHPHIVRLRDVGRDLRFLVFDFVSGRSLSQIVAQDGPQPIDSVVRWIAETAGALEYAGGAGVIHRDIKPANIMVTEEGSAMLLDLGLACLTVGASGWAENDEAFAGITRIGCTVGTADFMSPEQALSTDDVDSRSDIYSLGCTMYTAIAGRCPFHADNPILLAKKHITEAPPSIPGLDPELGQILERAMHKQPGDRFQTPIDLKDALDEWLNVPVAVST